MSNRWVQSRRWHAAGILLLSAWASGAARALSAGEQDSLPPVRTVVIGPQYQKGAVHRWLWAPTTAISMRRPWSCPS